MNVERRRWWQMHASLATSSHQGSPHEECTGVAGISLDHIKSRESFVVESIDFDTSFTDQVSHYLGQVQMQKKPIFRCIIWPQPLKMILVVFT